jgi:polysaccharide export outer membrane protein
MIPRPIRAAAAALAALALAGCATTLREQPAPEAFDAAALQAQSEYVIAAYDTLAIGVWKEPELSLPNVEVRLDGKISVPLLDDVQAAGKTPMQLKAEISERLREFVTAPQVTVVVTRVGVRNVYVLGEVVREGAFPIMPQMRVIDALAVAGGVSTFAGRSRIKVIRQTGTAPAELNFDYDAFVDGTNVAQNILLLPGDQIVVPEERPFWR